MRDKDTVPLANLRRDERFLLVDGDAIEYRYLWPSHGGITCADHRGEWVAFDAGKEVVRCR